VSIPSIAVNLIYPPSPTLIDIAPFLEQDTALDITSSFEAPGQTGTITAGEVSIKGLDVAGQFRSILSQIQPASTDFQIQIWRDGAKRFDGYILPNTVQFNAQEYSFSFSAVSIAARLATVQADDVTKPTLAALQRNLVGWTIVNTTMGVIPQIQIAGPGYCPLVIKDTIALVNAGKREEATVSDVTFDGSAWRVTLDTLGTNYNAGTPIELVTPFLHSVEIRTAVDGVLVGGGCAATVDPHFNASFFTGSQVFASADATVELIAGVRTPIAAPLGLALAGVRGTVGGKQLLAYTKDNQYRQDAPPTSVWTRLGSNPGGSRPIDWSRYGNAKTYTLSGLRSRTTPITDDAYGLHDWLTPTPWQGEVREYMFYCYDYTSDTFINPTRRYFLRICVDDYGNFNQINHFSLDFGYETTPDGYTWTFTPGTMLLSYDAMCSTKLHTLVPNVCGLDIDVLNGVIYFSNLEGDTTNVPVNPVKQTLSSFDISGPALHANIMAIGGAPHYYRAERLAVIAPGTAAIYYPAADGTAPFYIQTESLPLDFQPFSIVVDWGADPGGDVLHALSSSPDAGTSLLTFHLNLYPSASALSLLLLGSGPANGISEMIALQTTSGPWNLAAMIGNKLWWIGNTFSGVIDYLDLTNVSCGQVLSDLATLVNGWCYVDGTGASWFRSRNLPSGLLIGADASTSRIDDAGCLSLPESPILFGTYLFVRVESSQDSNTYGEAGDGGFRDGPLALILSNPFIPSSSFAAALAGMIFAYLGRPLAGFTALHQDDGRTYEPGAECWGQIGGQLRHFQLTSVTRQMLAVTVQAQGMEL
jgi:hypothetical protein